MCRSNAKQIGSRTDLNTENSDFLSRFLCAKFVLIQSNRLSVALTSKQRNFKVWFGLDRKKTVAAIYEFSCFKYRDFSILCFGVALTESTKL